jgi:hypothetical protein
MELPLFAETAAKMAFDREWHGKRREPPSPTRLRREPSPARGEGISQELFLKTTDTPHSVPSPLTGEGGMRQHSG